MKLPSKRLLSAVFSEREKLHYIGVGIHRIVNCSGNICEYEIHTGNFNNLNDDTAYRSINIYELMHLMKEWAVEDKGFMFSKLINFGAYTQYQVFIKQPSVEAEFMGTTEFEAMTKACEWILKEQNEK